MNDKNPAFQDAFNLLCGRKLGEGVHRQVFECRIRPDLVVKVEIEQHWRNFMNVFESLFWDDFGTVKGVGEWLAPVEYTSPDGRILLQRRAEPLTGKLPEMMPAFLADTKRENFGMIDGRVVCVDYALHHVNASGRMVKAKWVNER